MALTQEDIARVKKMGFLRNRGTELFSGRVVPEGTVFTPGELSAVAELAERFGSGKVVPTVRMTLEVVGIPYERIDEAVDFGAQRGLRFGGTGAKVRPVTSCKGTTCVFGMYDTQAVAREIHEKYYLGWDQVALPHKFKIAVGGLPQQLRQAQPQRLRHRGPPDPGGGPLPGLSGRHLGPHHPDGHPLSPAGGGG